MTEESSVLKTKQERESTADQLGRVSSQTSPRRTLLSRHQTIINFWLDSTLLVIFLSLVWVSVIVRFVFPPAGISAGYLLWNRTLNQWMEVQFGLLAVMCFGILLHLMMHWSWVCGVVSNRLLRRGKQKKIMDDGQRTIFGVGLLIVLLNIMGIGIALAFLSVESPL